MLNSIHSWLDNRFDLTGWVQNVTQAEGEYLVVILQLFTDDQRKPIDLVISNDDGTIELAKLHLLSTKIESMRYAHVPQELPARTSHRLEILLEENS